MLNRDRQLWNRVCAPRRLGHFMGQLPLDGGTHAQEYWIQRVRVNVLHAGVHPSGLADFCSPAPVRRLIARRMRVEFSRATRIVPTKENHTVCMYQPFSVNVTS